jgi:hypothetical protein
MSQRLILSGDTIERIYRAKRRPSDEEVEDLLEKAKRLRAPI